MNTLEFLGQITATIKRKFFLLFVLAFLPALVTYIYYKAQKGKYETYSKIFPLSINSAGSGSPFDAIKSQFGISDKTDYDKIYNVTELVGSKTITKLIVESKPSNSKHKTFTDWIIFDHNKNLPFYKKAPKTSVNTDSNDKNLVAGEILKSNLEIVTEKSDFTKIVTRFYDKELARQINETIIQKLSEFYIEMSTEKPNTEVAQLRHIRDSLKIELYHIESAIAGNQDASQFSVKYSASLPQARLARTRAEIEEQYAVSSTAYQNAKFKLLSQSPIFQVLDRPGEPYTFVKQSAAKFAVIVFMLSFFIISLIACRKIFWSLILEELSKS